MHILLHPPPLPLSSPYHSYPSPFSLRNKNTQLIHPVETPAIKPIYCLPRMYHTYVHTHTLLAPYSAAVIYYFYTAYLAIGLFWLAVMCSLLTVDCLSRLDNFRTFFAAETCMCLVSGLGGKHWAKFCPVENWITDLLTSSSLLYLTCFVPEMLFSCTRQRQRRWLTI